jgi:hypothetical protein
MTSSFPFGCSALRSEDPQSRPSSMLRLTVEVLIHKRMEKARSYDQFVRMWMPTGRCIGTPHRPTTAMRRACAGCCSRREIDSPTDPLAKFLGLAAYEAAGALGGTFHHQHRMLAKHCTGAHKLHRGREFGLALKGGT